MYTDFLSSCIICATKLAFISESIVHAFLVLCHRGLSASLDEGALALVYEAEQGHHVPVRDHEVDHGMGVGVGGKDAPEELTCCPKVTL